MEKLIKFICLNKEFIKIKVKSVLSIEMTIISIILAVLPFFSDFNLKNWDLCSFGKIFVVILFIFFIIFIAFVISCFCVLRRTKNLIWRKSNSSLSIIYDDIFDLKMEKDKKYFVVIPVDTQFMTDVDIDSQNIKYPRVAPNTLHGKFINKFYGDNTKQLKKEIKKYIAIKEYKIDENQQKKYPNSKAKRFEIGTVVQISPENDRESVFLLLALAEFNEHNRASCDKSKLIIALNSLFKFYDENCQGGDLYIPLMGTGFSRAGLTETESLRITKACAELNLDCIRGNVNIVIYKENRKDISIFQ